MLEFQVLKTHRSKVMGFQSWSLSSCSVLYVSEKDKVITLVQNIFTKIEGTKNNFCFKFVTLGIGNECHRQVKWNLFWKQIKNLIMDF